MDEKKFQDVIQTLKEVLGDENIHVIETEFDILEIELKQYLARGGYLH